MKLNQIIESILSIYEENTYCVTKDEIINLCIEMIELTRLYMCNVDELEIDETDLELCDCTKYIRYLHDEYDKSADSDEKYVNEYKSELQNRIKTLLSLMHVKLDILQNEQRLFNIEYYDLGNLKEISLICIKLSVLKNLLLKLSIFLKQHKSVD